MSLATARFHHEAFLYNDGAQFLEGTLDFIRAGATTAEPTLVVLAAAKNEALKARLGPGAARVEFADMAEVGANPARIIPTWRRFADVCEARGGPFRGIGEPIWAGRSADELVECQRHEALLNLAFAETSGFRLLCPYDTRALPPDVLDEAHRSHPSVAQGAGASASEQYRDLGAVAAPFDSPLEEPDSVLDELAVEPGSLVAARTLVVCHALESGVAPARAEELATAVNEIATNSLVHGGGRGSLRVWRKDHSFVCEVRDLGRIDDPLAGRVAPPGEQEGGRGLWLANQLCDLVQVRSFEAGSVVRLHMRVDG